MTKLFVYLRKPTLCYLISDAQLIACEEVMDNEFGNVFSAYCENINISSVKIFGNVETEEIKFVEKFFKGFSINDVQIFNHVLVQDHFARFCEKPCGLTNVKDLDKILLETLNTIYAILDYREDCTVKEKKPKVKREIPKMTLHSKDRVKFITKSDKKQNLLLNFIIVILIIIAAATQAIGTHYNKSLDNLSVSTTKNQIAIANMSEMKSYLNSYLSKYDSAIYSTYSEKLLTVAHEGCTISEIKMNQDSIAICCFVKSTPAVDKFVNNLKKQFNVRLTENLGMVEVENKSFNKYCITLTY